MRQESPSSTPDFVAISAMLLERSQEKMSSRKVFEQAERIATEHEFYVIRGTKRIPLLAIPQIIVRDIPEIILDNPDNVMCLTLNVNRPEEPASSGEFSISAVIWGVGPREVIGETNLYTLRRETVLNIRGQEASLAEIQEARALLDYIESELDAKGASRVPEHSTQRV